MLIREVVMTLAIKRIRNLSRYIWSVVLPSSIVIYSSGVNAAGENQFGAALGIASEQFAIHGQVTYVEQETSGFSTPYKGPNSLSPNSGKETVDTTLYVYGAPQ
jgi:hypothetical protein